MKILLLLALLFINTAFSKEINLEFLKDKTFVEFDAKGSPSILNIKGQKAKGSGQLKILEGILSGLVNVELNDFDTDMETRNEHMKEKYLETGKPGFNVSKLRLVSIILNKDFPEKVKLIENLPIEAMLTLHGIEKKVFGILTMKANSAEEYGGTLSFKLKLSDFGIEIPSFAGITVVDEVAVKSDYMAKYVANKL